MSTYGERFAQAVAQQLRAEKNNQGLTEEELAKSLGIHRVSMSRYLSGVRAVPLAVFADACQVLHTDALEVIARAKATVQKADQAGEPPLFKPSRSRVRRKKQA